MADDDPFHKRLQVLANRYGSARARYQRAMMRGRPDDADEAMGQMQEIKRSVKFLDGQ